MSMKLTKAEYDAAVAKKKKKIRMPKPFKPMAFFSGTIENNATFVQEEIDSQLQFRSQSNGQRMGLKLRKLVLEFETFVADADNLVTNVVVTPTSKANPDTRLDDREVFLRSMKHGSWITGGHNNVKNLIETYTFSEALCVNSKIFIQLMDTFHTNTDTVAYRLYYEVVPLDTEGVVDQVMYQGIVNQ